MVLPPSEPNDEEELEELSQDGITPFSPPDDSAASGISVSDDDTPTDDELEEQATAKLDPTHPATDTDIDEDDWYDEGLSGAAEAEEPNAHDAVIGYHKDKVHKKTKEKKDGNDKAA